MAKKPGFDEPNYTQTPNRLFDEIMKEIDTMAELKVTLAIIRQTAGWHRRRVTFGIGKIERLTGLARNSVISGAEAAEARGTIRRLSQEGEASWELVISDTPSTDEGAEIDPATNEDVPPQTLTKKPSEFEGLKRKKEIKQIVDEANKKVDTVLHFEAEGQKARAKGKAWNGRESFPENLWALADGCVSIFGAPSKQYLSGWLLEIGDWYDRGGTPAHLEAAKKEMSSWSAKPNTPMGIGNLVRRIIQEGKSNAPAIDQSAVEHTKATVDEKFAGTFVPRPASVQPPALAFKNLAQQKGIRK